MPVFRKVKRDKHRGALPPGRGDLKLVGALIGYAVKQEIHNLLGSSQSF
ncbi:hypothetical protein J4207_04405 [Candidatus Woesearchaeota archaeon]|nr:hypothetical protein [Candidatus Woesearchaeota archaeon]